MSSKTKLIIAKSIASIPGIFFIYLGVAVSTMPQIGVYIGLLFWPAGLVWTLSAVFAKPKH